jgi:hypothetical protein
VTAIHRLAIIDRGEPAMRCVSAVAELNRDFRERITTIALYTQPDAASWFRPGGQRGHAAQPADLRRRWQPPRTRLP